MLRSANPNPTLHWRAQFTLSRCRPPHPSWQQGFSDPFLTSWKGLQTLCTRACSSIVYALGGRGLFTEQEDKPAWNLSSFESNLYWRAGSAAHGKDFPGNQSLAEWQASGVGGLGGQDKSSVEADPLFTDLATGDYGLLAGSPALKLGFKPIDLSAVGPRPNSIEAAAPGKTAGGTGAGPAAQYLWNVGGSSAIAQDDLPKAVAMNQVVLFTSYYGQMPCLDCGTPHGNHGHQWCNGGM